MKVLLPSQSAFDESLPSPEYGLSDPGARFMQNHRINSCHFALRRVDMTTYAESFKREVARVSKKEVRGEITPLRKATSTHRSEIAALKKTVTASEARQSMHSGSHGLPRCARNDSHTLRKAGRQSLLNCSAASPA